MVKEPRILLVYPNLPLMMAPAISMGIFNAIGKREGCIVDIFETTQYSKEYNNKHIRLSEIGSARPNKEEEVKGMFFIKDPDNILPDLKAKLEEFKPHLILISVQEDVWRMTRDLLSIIKPFNIPTILGGIFPTAAPNLVLSNSLVDIIGLHEGERTVLDAINAIKIGQPITSIDGIWWKDSKGNIIRNKPQPLCNITDVTPDFSVYGTTRWQRPMGGKIFKSAVSMETYRGCPYNCTYCNSPFTRDFSKNAGTGKYIRRKSPEKIDSDFQYYRDLYNPDLIMFQDDSFLARPKKEIFELCKLWSKHKTPFWMNTRIENCHPELLEALKEAGIYRMQFGIESGNEKYRRDILKRNASNDKYLEYFEHINNSNIPYSLNAIIGMPFETREMVLETASLIHQAKGYDGLTLAMFQPYHGTDLRRLAVENNFIPKNFINSDTVLDIGGFLDSWNLNMPSPYLQKDEVEKLTKSFALYCFYGPDKFDLIKRAETDESLFKQLLAELNAKFFTKTQIGGADRIKRLKCSMHDESSSYNFEEVDDKFKVNYSCS